MTSEEYFESFFEKYGAEFTWVMLPFSDHSYVENIKRALGENIPEGPTFSVAKCKITDEVLFLIGDRYRIYHLFGSQIKQDESLKYVEFGELALAMEYIEKEYIANEKY